MRAVALLVIRRPSINPVNLLSATVAESPRRGVETPTPQVDAFGTKHVSRPGIVDTSQASALYCRVGLVFSDSCLATHQIESLLIRQRASLLKPISLLQLGAARSLTGLAASSAQDESL